MLSLDHLGVAVRDLAQAQATYSRLGFKLTDLSIHSGQPNADGQVQALGSGNHCAMFHTGYLELIGVVDPNKPSSVAPFLKTRHGGFITALGCENANAAYETAVRDFPATQRPVALERMVDDPDGGQAKAEFRNVLMGTGFPESRVLMIQHLTRDVIWRERDMTHPNGVVALSGAQFLVADAAEPAGRYGRLIGAAPETTPNGAVLKFGGQTIRFFGQGQAGAPDAYCPSLCGAVFTVADLAATDALLRDNGISFAKGPAGDLMVPPDQACGFSLTFTASDKRTS
jgi:catechol 2,3-dioxygenase-like lactoylglutathione lyase family enzyme